MSEAKDDPLAALVQLVVDGKLTTDELDEILNEACRNLHRHDAVTVPIIDSYHEELN